MIYNIDTFYGGGASFRSYIRADSAAAAHAKCRQLLRSLPGIQDGTYIGAISYEVPGFTVERIATCYCRNPCGELLGVTKERGGGYAMKCVSDASPEVLPTFADMGLTRDEWAASGSVDINP